MITRVMTIATTMTMKPTTNDDDENHDNEDENETLMTMLTTIIITMMMITMTEANDGDVGWDFLDPQNDSSVDEKCC